MDFSKLNKFTTATKEATARFGKSAFEAATKASEVVVTSAVEAQKNIEMVSGKVKDKFDDMTETLPIKDLPKVPGNQALYEVLDHMARDELTNFYAGPLAMSSKKDKDLTDNANDQGLRHHVAGELLTSAKNSMALWKELPPYDEVVRLVAKRIHVSESTKAEVPDVERAILFKIVDLSISKMTDEETQKLTKQVEAELAARGVKRKVTLSEVRKFISFAEGELVTGAVSLAGSAGGFAGTVIGVNGLQMIVLKGIIATSGYMSAGGALLGFGAGGTMMTIAGAAGPIALVLGTLYASYSLTGPAFRKLIPCICVIAAKRIEILASEQPGAVAPNMI
jgi:uncharacterized protein YaaW (UPF0174 family)